MSEVNGKLCTCDRCGLQIFLRTTGDGEADGGRTRWNKSEPYPPNWASHLDTGRLCPTCERAYQHLLADFLKKPNT